MSFAIAKSTGLMYEGRGGSYLPLVNTPMLSHARIVDPDRPHANEGPLLSRFEGQPGFIFREDQFDPVTRTRRGRLYEGGQHSRPTSGFYALPHPHEVPNMDLIRVAGAKIDLFVYEPAASLIADPARMNAAILGLGAGSFETRWRVIAAELVGYGDLLLTLRSLSAMGVLPILEPESIPTRARDEVAAAVDHVVAAALRETAGSVVDQCRHALTTILSAFLFDRNGDKQLLQKDLGDLSKALQKDWGMLAASAFMVARMHNKTKPSARVEHGLHPPVDDDALYCVHAVGSVLRELGWARTT